LVGPTVFRGPRNFAPRHGIWVFAAELIRGIDPQNAAEFYVYKFVYDDVLFDGDG